MAWKESLGAYKHALTFKAYIKKNFGGEKFSTQNNCLSYKRSCRNDFFNGHIIGIREKIKRGVILPLVLVIWGLGLLFCHFLPLCYSIKHPFDRFL